MASSGDMGCLGHVSKIISYTNGFRICDHTTIGTHISIHLCVSAYACSADVSDLCGHGFRSATLVK